MTLLVMFGPPAVGKMTVGRAIADTSDFRLAEKKSKRDLAWSDANVREMEQEFQMNTDRRSVADELLSAYPHLRTDNTDVPAEEVAARVLAWLGSLPR